MAENPQRAQRPRPLSPFVTIYHWPVTMATSITHRMIGMGLAAGLVVLVWWLVAIASGPEAFSQFTSLAATPLGQHAQEIYKAFDAAGSGGVDFSGVIRHIRDLAGK